MKGSRYVPEDPLHEVVCPSPHGRNLLAARGTEGHTERRSAYRKIQEKRRGNTRTSSAKEETGRESYTFPAHDTVCLVSAFVAEAGVHSQGIAGLDVQEFHAFEGAALVGLGSRRLDAVGVQRHHRLTTRSRDTRCSRARTQHPQDLPPGGHQASNTQSTNIE